MAAWLHEAEIFVQLARIAWGLFSESYAYVRSEN